MWLRSRVCPYGAGDPWRRRRTDRSRSHPPCLIKFLCVHKLSVCACVRAYVSVCVLVTFQEVITAGKVTYMPTTPVKTQNLKTYPLRDFHHGQDIFSLILPQNLPGTDVGVEAGHLSFKHEPATSLLLNKSLFPTRTTKTWEVCVSDNSTKNFHMKGDD